MDKIDSSNIDIQKTTKIKRLLSIFWALETVLTIVAIQHFLNNSWHITAIMFFSIISILPVYFLAKKGKTELGSNILLIFLTVILLGFIWKYDGLRDEVLMVFPAIIMVSLLMSSRNFALYIYLLVSINILALGYHNEI